MASCKLALVEFAGAGLDRTSTLAGNFDIALGEVGGLKNDFGGVFLGGFQVDRRLRDTFAYKSRITSNHGLQFGNLLEDIDFSASL